MAKQKRPTLAEIKAGPPTLTIAQASAAFGFSESLGYDLARRGEFPARVIPAGRRKVVVTASVVAALSGKNALVA